MVPEAAQALIGKPLTEETIEAAGAAAAAAARPIDDMRGSIKQRKHLAGVLTERTIRRAAERAQAVQKSNRFVAATRRHLGGAELAVGSVEQEQIGKRAADIHANLFHVKQLPRFLLNKFLVVLFL